MDLQIAGRRAIVCAASKGLGRACALALAENGVDLVLNARGADGMEELVFCEDIASVEPALAQQAPA